jgi:hypothetical protein
MFHLYGMTFDGDASFLFKVHVVQHLTFCDLYSFCAFKQTVGKCALAVVDMRNNAKVSDVFHQYV